jgi:hypothetical protein
MSWVRIPPNPLRYRSLFLDSLKKIDDTERVCMGIDDVAGVKKGEQTANSSISSLQTATTYPWMILPYALKAAATGKSTFRRLTCQADCIYIYIYLLYLDWNPLK